MLWKKKKIRKKVRTTEVNKIVTVVLKKDDISYADEAYQWNYGQILRIQGGNLPKAVEVHFSLEETSGTSVTRIGTTTDGVTEAPIPDSLLENNNCSQGYTIYAYIYLEDGTAGRTEYEIAIPVKARTKPEVPGTPEEPELFRETVKAVNDAADRAAASEQNAKASEVEAGKHAASASKSAVAAEKTKEDALKEVGEKKQKAIEAIQEQEETSVGKIVNHTDNEIKRIQNQTADSKAGLEQTITNAGVSKEELDESIQTAGDTKTALDKSTELAGTAKTELDASTQKAGEAKTALDGSARTAGEMQETLSATVKQAGALDTSLGEKIKTGTQLNKDITASGEKAVQDIQNAGSEQLGKMQTVTEEFTADREQITTNKEDIGSLKEDLDDLNKRLTEYDGYNTLNLSYGKVSSMSTEITFNTDNRYVHTPLTLFGANSKVGLSGYTDKYYTLYIKNEDGTFTRFYNQRADKIFTEETYAYVVFNFYPETAIQSIDDFSQYIIYENKTDNFHDTMTAKVEKIELEISACSSAEIFENRKYGLVYNGEIDRNTGNLIEQTNTNKKVSDFIPLQGVAKLVCETVWSGVKLYFYDSKKNFIKNLNYSNSKKYFELKLTDEYGDASYVRYAGYDNKEEFLNYYLISVKNYPNATSKFNNKNVLIFGDSITDACEITVNDNNQTTAYSFRGLDSLNRKMWSAILKDSYNFKEVRNYALSGATWKGDLSKARASSFSQITIALNDLNNPNGVFNQDIFTPDIVIFALGINDASSNDTYEDAMNKTILIDGTNNIDVESTLNNLDHSKFNESVRWALLKIKSQFPFAQVYVSLPLQCAKVHTVYGSTLVSDIRKMAERCGCIIIDSTNEVGIIPEGNFYNDGTKIGITLQDGLHPNAVGQQMLARAIIGKLNDYYYPID